MRLGVGVLGVFLSVGLIVQRAANADAPQPAPAQSSTTTVLREGRISVARGIVGGAPGSSADAVFTNTPVWGAVIATDGPCTLRKRLPTTVGLSAGTITITGTVAPITLIEQRDAGVVRYRRSSAVPNPAYVEDAQITVEASGGSDIPAFTGTVAAPRELAGYTPPTALSRTGGYTARWTAVSGSEIMIVLGAINTRREGLLVVCRLPDSGTFTVPPSTFKLIPQSLDRAIVIVARIAETVKILGDARVMIDVASAVTSGPFLLDPLERRKPSETSPAEQSPPRASPRLFLTVGFGFGEAWRTWRFQLGQRLARRLHLVEELNFLGSSYISADTLEEFGSFGAGIRWTPFKPTPRPSRLPLAPFIDVHAFYFTAVVGAAFRDRLTTTMPDSSEVIDWSPMASLAVGLLEVQGRDWTLGPEFRGQLARFDGKLQPGWQLMLAIHLNQW